MSTRYAEQWATACGVLRVALAQRARGDQSRLADLVEAAWAGQEHIDRVVITGLIAAQAIAALEALPASVRAQILGEEE